MTSNNQKAVETVEVLLKRPHTHKGVFYDVEAIKEGAKIHVRPKQAEVLKKAGVI